MCVRLVYDGCTVGKCIVDFHDRTKLHYVLVFPVSEAGFDGSLAG